MMDLLNPIYHGYLLPALPGSVSLCYNSPDRTILINRILIDLDLVCVLRGVSLKKGPYRRASFHPGTMNTGSMART